MTGESLAGNVLAMLLVLVVGVAALPALVERLQALIRLLNHWGVRMHMLAGALRWKAAQIRERTAERQRARQERMGGGKS